MCLGRASQKKRFHSCLLSFLVQIRYIFRLTSPSMNLYQLKRYFPFYCSGRSLLCVRTFLCQMYTSPDKANWQLCRHNGLPPPITRHALHPFINALSKSHGVYMNWILRCCVCCSMSLTEFLCYIGRCVTFLAHVWGMWSCNIRIYLNLTWL